MYEEIVKALRNCDFPYDVHYCRNCVCQLEHGGSCDCRRLFPRAADAIEELSKKYLASEVDNTNLTGLLATEHAKHLWIPVTERLPECEWGAEVENIEWISCGMVFAGCFGRGGKYRDAYFRTWTDAGEGMDAKDADYWRAVTLPEPPKEEH